MPPLFSESICGEVSSWLLYMQIAMKRITKIHGISREMGIVMVGSDNGV
jgi:hypothetical protein